MANVEIPEGLEELFEQTWFDHFLHYGLLVGAIFQLVCIAAIVVIPATPEEDTELGGHDSSTMGGSSRSSEDTGDSTRGGATVGSVPKKSNKKARKRK